MKPHAGPRTVVLAAGLLAAGCGVAGGAPDADAAGETWGFVLSMWRDVVPEVALEHCPDGLNLNETEYFGIPPNAVREARARLGSLQAAEDEVFPPDACRDPLAQPDPGFITFDADVPLPGLDLDGLDSTRGTAASAPTTISRAPPATAASTTSTGGWSAAPAGSSRKARYSATPTPAASSRRASPSSWK